MSKPMKLWLVFYEVDLPTRNDDFFFVLASDDKAAKVAGEAGLKRMFGEEGAECHPLIEVEAVSRKITASDGKAYDISKGWPV